MREIWRIVVAIVPMILLTFATALGQNSTTFRIGPEKAVGGATKEERAARQAELFGWLTNEIPAGTLDTPVRVGVTQQELADLATPQPPPLRIGLVKSFSPGIDISPLQHGQLLRQAGPVAGGRFQGTADGGFIWTISITSPGATGLRLHVTNFSLPESADLYVYSSDGQVRGPYQGRGPDGSGEFWTNTIFTDTAVIVLRHFGPYTAQDLRSSSFVITELAHVSRGLPSAKPRSTWTDGHCGNAACVVDASCENSGPAAVLKDAVAKIQWIQGAFIYTCTGGLIADTDNSSQRKLFLTANHCVSKNVANLETFFNYSTDSCNGTCPTGTEPAETTGATVLATGRRGDFTLLELGSGSLPSGAVFLGWNSSAIAFTNNAHLYRVSNPNFGPQVYSEHDVNTSAPTCTSWPRGERIYSRDVVGATDGGSSGSPVVNSASEVVGQLSGACGTNVSDACDATHNATVDGAFAYYFADVQRFLDPATSCIPTLEVCNDGVDNDCNGLVDCADTNACSSDPACSTGGTCTLGRNRDACNSNADCCSGNCRGGVCRGN
jgi:hypothetical protein